MKYRLEAQCSVCGNRIGYILVNKPIYDKSGLKKGECIKTMVMPTSGLCFQWLCDTCALAISLTEE